MGYASSGSGRSATALVLIALGAFFLLAQFGIFSFNVMQFLWPFFIILPGLAFLVPAWRGGADAAPLAIPGAIITGSGAILLYQSMTGRWESWAYIWALYPVFLGLGMMLMGRRTGRRDTYGSGRGLVRWGLIVFLVLGAFFELFVFNRLGISRYLLPAALILLGAWMLLRRGDDGPAKRAEDDPFTGTPAPRRYAPSASDELRRRIDLALAEDDDLPPPDDSGPADA